ncbi:class I SAM-dependent methyltransferase [Agrilactobacillus yilanensis]|uniref:Class I SAM-dependent methyltransferase n=1 Tax=Agrilactobacillus yilanensis TaxID=2485997 RepID=A0ABW4J8A8_9LACO|nr:class I SAM-dependent methyltransferase [Agrilactobacillus yilanensis]
MSDRPVKELFDLLDESTSILKSDLNTSYLDALAENLGNIIDHKHIKVENDRPTAATIEKLQAIYEKIELTSYDRTSKRQALQLIGFKGMQQDRVEPNKRLTPDAIGYMVAYLAQQLGDYETSSKVLDIAVGSGNLILTVMAQLQRNLKIELKGFGIDNDSLLLDLAAVFSQWLQLDLELYHQDAVMPLLVKDVDLIVSDLPVGYYPVDQQAKDYQTRAQQGHSYTHHLLIEQGIRSLKPAGLGLFVVPTAIFQSEESKTLTEWLTKAAYFQGLLNLPTKMFTDASAQKSILVLQKQGGQAEQVSQILLGDLPDFNDRQALTRFTKELQQWQQNYFKK